MSRLTATLALAPFFLLFSCGQPADAGDMTKLPDAPLGLAGMKLKETPGNPLTAEKANLGKKLFFDKRLSSNGAMSCETCHLHEKGWTDGEQFSTKVSGSANTRNSPTLYNVGYHPKLYWDGRKDTLEGNIDAAWKGHMGGDAETMSKALVEVAAYKEAFQAAFGGEPTGERIAQALASFVRTLRSGNSAWDRFQAGDEDAVSDDAKAGYTLFSGKAGCVACHAPPLYTDMMFHNVGIGSKAETPDPGRGKLEPSKAGAFKTPTLRSVSKTAPYFHDGSVATLLEAVELMAKGGIDNPNKDPLAVNRSLDDKEIGQLIAFLKSLDSTEDFTAPKLP